MPDTITKSPSLEQIDFNDFSPKNLITKKLPSISYKEITIIGFVTERQMDKYIRDTRRIAYNENLFLDSSSDNTNLTFTITPVNKYGRTKCQTQQQN